MPLEYSKNGKLPGAFRRIVNSLKCYISILRQSQKDPQYEECETVPISAPNQTEHILSNGSKLIFLDPEPGRRSHQAGSSYRRWSLDDASQAENRVIIEPPYEASTTDTEPSSTQSEPFEGRCGCILDSVTSFRFWELGIPLAKLLCILCRLKRRAKERKVKARCEKHQEIIRQLVERLEPAVEERGYGEMPLEFRMWEYATTELDEREKAKYEFLPVMLSNWVKRFLRWRGYRV